jgi:hypothetical protein
LLATTKVIGGNLMSSVPDSPRDDDEEQHKVGKEQDAPASADDATRDDEELALTPGGYRPRKNITQVKPDEAVSVDKEGNATIVPKLEEKDTEDEADAAGEPKMPRPQATKEDTDQS